MLARAVLLAAVLCGACTSAATNVTDIHELGRLHSRRLLIAGERDPDNAPSATCITHWRSIRPIPSGMGIGVELNYGEIWARNARRIPAAVAGGPDYTERYTDIRVYSHVTNTITGRQPVLSNPIQIPVPSFIMPGNVHTPMSRDLSFDFSSVNWFGADAAYVGWDYKLAAGGSNGDFPRYQTQPAAGNANQRAMEKVWPLGPHLSVKYKPFGYALAMGALRRIGIANDAAPSAATAIAAFNAGAKRGLKYSLAVVTPGNIDLEDFAGSATGSTPTAADRRINAGYFWNSDESVTAMPADVYDASHSLGDLEGGPAKYWNLSPLQNNINRLEPFSSFAGSSNAWKDFNTWIITEARNAAVATADPAPPAGRAVYVFHKFIYCDLRYGSATYDMAPRAVLFYGYSTYTQTLRYGYVTNWPPQYLIPPR